MGLNFTASHPAAAGIAADWAKANYIIDQIRGIPTMTVPITPGGAMTQSLMRIDELWTSDEVWLSEKPKTRMIREHGPDSRLTVDNDMRQFFKSSSREGDQVIYRPIVGIKRKHWSCQRKRFVLRQQISCGRGYKALLHLKSL